MEKISHMPTGTLYELLGKYEGRSDFEGSAIHKGIQSEINERDRGTLWERFQSQIDGAHSAAASERSTVSNLRKVINDLKAENVKISGELEALKKKNE